MNLRQNRGLILTVIIWGLLALAGFIAEEWALAQLSIYIAYGIFAMGLSLIWGQAGVLSFGQAIFFGAGAYGFSLVTLGMLPGLGASALAGIAAAVVVSALLAAVTAWFTLAGRGLSGAHFAIVTLCAAAVVETAATRSDFLGGYNGLFGVPPLMIGDEVISLFAQYYAMLAIALAVFVTLTLLLRTPFGTVLLAIREDENRAAHLGYDTRWLKSCAFILAGALSGLAGALFASQLGFVSPTLLGFTLSTQVLIWVAVGGRSVLMAAFLGAIIVPGAENTLSTSLGDVWLLLIGGLFVLSVVLFRNGVFGGLLELRGPARLSGVAPANAGSALPASPERHRRP